MLAAAHASTAERMQGEILEPMIAGLHARGGRRKRYAETTADRVLQGLLAFVVLGSALALGGVHVPVIVIVTVVTSLMTALALRISPPEDWFELLRSPAGLALVLATLSFVQSIPMPIAVLRWIAPDNADVWSRSLIPLGEKGPSWASISLDPGASVVESMKWFTYAGVFACSNLLARRRGRARGVVIVFASGVVVALVTIVHGLAGATNVYGFYVPHFGTVPWHVGPLLNTNNLAGYLNLAAMSGLALLMSRQTELPRWLAALGTTLVGATVVIAASRGGVLALLLGLLLLAVLVGLGNEDGNETTLPKRTAALLFALATAGGALFGVLGSTRETWAELYDKNVLKIRMLGWARPMIREHFWLGIGRGAFESVFPAYRVYSEHAVFTHAENFPAQWMSEWGVPVAVAAMLSFAWFLRPKTIGLRRSILAAGVAVGIGILLLQNLFDLGLEVSSVCIVLAVAFGSIWGGWDRSARSWRVSEAESRTASVVGGSVFVATMVIILLAIFPFCGLHDVASDREDIHRMFRAWVGERTATRTGQLRQELRRSMMLHPAEPYFPLIAAQAAWLGGSRENPMPALSRSLERSSQNGRAHLLLAQILTSRGAASQARLELRLAVLDEPALASVAAEQALKSSVTTDELLETVPVGETGVSMLGALYYGIASERARLPLLQELLRRDPQNANGHALLADHNLAELTSGNRTGVCAGERRAVCEEEIERSAAIMAERAPRNSTADQYRARLLMVNGKAEEAEALLAARCPQVDDAVACQFLRASAAAAVKGKPEILQTAARDLQRVACASAQECASTAASIGELFAGRGEWGTAFKYFRRASQGDPNENRWLRLADAAANVGFHAQAADALEKVVLLRGGADGALRARIESERNQAMGIMVRE
jgi:tetratricopeptide (TPR) repeat protein